MDLQLNGIKAYFDSTSSPAGILQLNGGQLELIYANTPFLIFFGKKGKFEPMNLISYYEESGLKNVFNVVDQIKTSLKKVLSNDDSEKMEISHEVDKWEVSTSFLLEGSGVKYFSHTLREVVGKSEEAKRHEKKTLASLKSREAALKNIFDQSLDVICTIDEFGNFQQVSSASREVWGYSPEELKGKAYIDLVHQDDREITLAVAEKVLNGEDITNFQNKYVHKDGRIITVNWSVSWDYSARLMYCVAKDVTILERNYQEIKRSEFRFRGFYESSTNFIIRTDLEGNYTYCNKKYQDDFGWLYPGESMIGKQSRETIMPYHLDRLQDVGDKCIQNPGKVFKVELDKPKENGEVMTTLWDFLIIVDDEGNPLEIQCMGVDISERIKFEKDLQASNERFELVMQAGSECIWDYDPESGDLFLGDGFRRIFGISPLELHLNNSLINSYFHPEDKSWLLSLFKETLEDRGKNLWNGKFRLRKEDGSYAQVEDKAIVLRDEQGKAYRVVGAMRDISLEVFFDRVEMMEREVMAHAMQVDAEVEDVLKLQLCKLEDIFPEMKTSIMRIKDDKVFPLVSPSLPETYLEEISGSPIGENTGSCGTAAYLRKKVIVSDIQNDIKWDKYKELGKKYGFKACWSQPIFNSEGSVVATFANYYETVKSPNDQEIQAMDRVQRLVSLILEKFDFVEKIKLSNERFENVTEATNDAIWDFDVVNNNLYWSKGFENQFNYDMSDTEPSFDFLISRIHEKDRARVIERVQTFFKDRKSISWFEEYQFKRGDGSFAYVIDRAKFIRDHEGNVIRVIGAMTDITHLKEYESSLESLNRKLDARAKELAHSNAELEQFAYIASHDLQEPLRMVTGFLKQIEKNYGDILDDKGKKYIHFAVDGAVRMKNIILDLLEFSRVGKDLDNKEVFSLNDLVDEVLYLNRKSVEEKKAIIKSDQLPDIQYFKTPLFQVFKNLIENAIKYSHPHKRPEIKISCEESSDYWTISISDNGIGIEKEYFDKVFILFQRLHTREKYLGTGMGLAIAKKIVEGLGGEIWVDSIPEKGSIFSFTIPKKLKKQI
ncbi:MAG: PAS domain S-box protein [Mongoliibacter sp.]|uniref:PAS domain S-box protein n=1 Tax=Mongoliibacter sp. TaxID=2022438 RepID=UPI0012F1F804|nr:PAS domain S-box protein [Mongoliibacter sp.]TVP50400.1 MAG: PAS domain S-box protein [Mongoliibacter sp.]